MPEHRLWRGLSFAFAPATRRRSARWSLDERNWFETPRAAVRNANSRVRTIWQSEGVYITRFRARNALELVEHGRAFSWQLGCSDPRCFETGLVEFDRRPTRREALRYLARARARLPDDEAPSELGWRAWDVKQIAEHTLVPRHNQVDVWSFDQPAAYNPPRLRTCLVSPHQSTVWHESELRAPSWTDASAVRGNAGIHARRLPHNWRLAGWFAQGHNEGPQAHALTVHGIVERFGRFVLGTTGWRAEWVIVRELEAPTQAIAEGLRLSYPDVKVHLKGDLKDEDY